MGEVFFNRPWRGTADGQAVFEKHNFLIKYSMKYSFSVLLPAPAQRLFRWLSPGYDGYVRTISDWHKLLLDVVDKREADMATGQFADADDFLTVVLKNGSLSRNEKLGMFAGSLNGSYDTYVRKKERKEHPAHTAS